VTIPDFFLLSIKVDILLHPTKEKIIKNKGVSEINLILSILLFKLKAFFLQFVRRKRGNTQKIIGQTFLSKNSFLKI